METLLHREDIEWCDAWITDGQGTSLPRVMLIGDSITRGYYPQVSAALKGRASLSRLCTSKSVGDPALLAELAVVLQQYRWDIVHFNNGMHGFDYTEAEYERAYPDFIATIKKHAPDAKLICATTTPVYSGTELAPLTDRVIVRNKSAIAEAERNGIAIDDLFSVIHGHPEYSSPDGVHASSEGISAQAAHVTDCLVKAL